MRCFNVAPPRPVRTWWSVGFECGCGHVVRYFRFPGAWREAESWMDVHLRKHQVPCP